MILDRRFSIPVLLLALSLGCSDLSKSRSADLCMDTFIRPVVTVQNPVAMGPAELTAAHVLAQMGFVEKGGQFYFPDGICYVQLEWSSESKLTISPLIAERSSMTAEEFTDEFLTKMARRLSSSDLQYEIAVYEEVVFQD